ncbi:hypothetical protein [Snuella lapsa]|uniref:Thioredoxin family protein n=1 Tax=Snuella lapsa TaxID=870481 RepID=A0ABP6YDP7_9FLAO
MKLYFWILTILITVLSCEHDSKNDYAYIGGEVVSPKNDIVFINHSNEVIDTVRLDKNNRFIYKFDNLIPGLYSFSLQSSEGLEYQTVLLEPNDSILFRLNTLDFDESLVYTGIGAKKNNYFIDEFLKNENEVKEIFKLCQLTPAAYDKHVDSIKHSKDKNLDTFKGKNKTSDLFNSIARANIDFNYYYNKEIYPFVHYGNKAEILKELPKDFYAFRQQINYSDNNLKDNHIYKSFLKYSLSNLALSSHFKHSQEDNFNWLSTCYNLDRLNLIDSLVANNTLKNELLFKFTMNFLTRNNNETTNKKIIASYLSKSSSEENNEEIKLFANSLSKLKVGTSIPNVKVINLHNSNENPINSLINSPTVIFFWSHKFYNHFKDSHNKINELKLKYPEVKFISINIDDYDTQKWKTIVERNKIINKDEYKFQNPSESTKALAIWHMTKTILVDEDQKIVNSNTNIFERNFEEQLLGLINK